jgi:hypothetical protein
MARGTRRRRRISCRKCEKTKIVMKVGKGGGVREATVPGDCCVKEKNSFEVVKATRSVNKETVWARGHALLVIVRKQALVIDLPNMESGNVFFKLISSSFSSISQCRHVQERDQTVLFYVGQDVNIECHLRKKKERNDERVK